MPDSTPPTKRHDVTCIPLTDPQWQGSVCVCAIYCGEKWLSSAVNIVHNNDTKKRDKINLTIRKEIKEGNGIAKYSRAIGEKRNLNSYGNSNLCMVKKKTFKKSTAGPGKYIFMKATVGPIKNLWLFRNITFGKSKNDPLN